MLGVRSLRFRVKGQGFGIGGLGVRSFRVEFPGWFGAWGFWFRVTRVRCRVSSFGFQFQEFGLGVEGAALEA